MLVSALLSRDAPLAAALATIIGLIGWHVVAYCASPLRKFPGPFFAGWSNLWRLWLVSTRKYQWKMKELHEKYGPVVRIGPNLLDLDYPELIKILYGTDAGYTKTEFYRSNSALIGGEITYNLFSTSDQAEHARLKRPIAKYYSVGSISGLEPLMDDVISDFCTHLETHFMLGENEGKQCDLGSWIAYYTWDLISAATFSDRFGYMKRACDFDGTIGLADKAIDYFALVGQLPILDYILDKNRIVSKLGVGPPNLENVTRISVERLVARLQGRDTKFDAVRPDFLQHFLEAGQANPDLVSNKVVVSYLLINMVAGADTTAIALRAVFYFLLRNRRVYEELEEQVVAKNFDTTRPVPYSSARALPYLEAVVRESMRMHPSVGMPLERYVPAGGLSLPDGGGFVPQGAGVGINPYVMGRNKSVWGEDADEFRPERWLKAEHELEEAYRCRLNEMKAADLTFGGGRRICIGRNIALLEVYKVVATLISRYEMELADANREWDVVSSWFPRQKGIVVYLHKRPGRCETR